MREGRPTIAAGTGAFPRGKGTVAQRAFSLAELLVVIGIIAILAAIGLPALRGLGESNAIDAATRQLLDDLAYARNRALNDRTTVYLLFVPPNIEDFNTNLAPYRFTGYTLFSRRSVGDQPGRQSPRQLTPWRQLPDKVFIPATKFFASGTTNLMEQPLAWTNNFPLVITNRLYESMPMYYLAFNSMGQAVRIDGVGRQEIGRDEFIPLVKGSIFHPQDAQGRFVEGADIVEVPPGNRRYVKVNWLTGRAEFVGDAVRLNNGQTIVARGPQ